MGTVNIQSEINGCMKTYGYSDVGDVFGIHSLTNYGLKLKKADPISASEISHRKVPSALEK